MLLLKCVFLPLYFKDVKQLIYIFLSILIFSCSNKRKDVSSNFQDRSKLSIVVAHDSLENIYPTFEKEVANWQEFKTVVSFIQKFQKVLFLKMLDFDGNYQVGIKKNMKPKMVPMVTRNILYSVD